MIDQLAGTFHDDRAYPMFYAAKAMTLDINDVPTNTPAYLGYRWHDEQGRRCTQIIADMPFATATELARRMNVSLEAQALLLRQRTQELADQSLQLSITRTARKDAEATVARFAAERDSLQHTLEVTLDQLFQRDADKRELEIFLKDWQADGLKAEAEVTRLSAVIEGMRPTAESIQAVLNWHVRTQENDEVALDIRFKLARALQSLADLDQRLGTTETP